MQLDQQTIVVVMVVVYASTLAISAGLLGALRPSAAGRLWALGHLLVSVAGLVLAANASARLVYVSAGGAAAFIAGRLLIYRGVRVYYGMASWDRTLAVGVTLAALALVGAAGMAGGQARMHVIGYGSLALVAVLTVVTLLHAYDGRRSVGTPLVVIASLIHLATHLAGFAAGLAGNVASGPFYASSANGILLVAPLVGTLLALFGFTVMAMEQVIATNENGARLDALTRLLNRGALDKAAISLVAAWERHGQPLSCLVIDIDHFKQVNDRHGHHAGDTVLKLIAEAIDNSRRASDVAGRYGGEEFCILCPHTDEGQATALASRILKKVRGIALPGESAAFASVSIGVAELRGGAAGVEGLWRALFAAADRALYAAKEFGRDRYALASWMAPSTRPVPGDVGDSAHVPGR
ncbi:sensor domain-containing diguanylate cyclase [Cupriavidus basilensis]|uniref:diguanylate cyclase n=1 Tax=Cupriavidus basilensis TaxID=68895 RepID=A0A0C4YTQ9_9BURK|nr:GGDEF domain-containing protein [Cupriavidus basilensis]AJG24011.1 diguanylate cyclase (GGDEF domain) with PAS/PAC sensor [Cupriavidus basilensis]